MSKITMESATIVRVGIVCPQEDTLKVLRALQDKGWKIKTSGPLYIGGGRFDIAKFEVVAEYITSLDTVLPGDAVHLLKKALGLKV